MKAPVSWIREYVDLPADVTTEELAARLTALGLKLEAIEKPGDQITGPLVVGTRADHGARAAEERQDHQLVHRRRRPDETPTAPASRRASSAARTTSRPATWSSWCCPAAVLPGELRDLRAQDLRPRLGRDDLLGRASSASARTTTASSCCRPTPVSPATTPSRCSGSARRSSSSRSTPTVPTRSRCAASRARPRWRSTRRSATRPSATVPAPNGDGYPVVVDDPAGCPVFVARTVTGFDPAAPTPDWMARRIDPGRDAPDLAGRRRHQLRDARARPADPRLRRRQARRRRSGCAGPPRASG